MEEREFANYHRFLVRQSDVELADETLRIVETEAHHAINVLRLNRGDLFIAIDGKGQEYLAEFLIPDNDSFVARIISSHRRTTEPLLNITLAQGAVKGSKTADVVERATEVGVSSIVFFKSSKSKHDSENWYAADRMRRVALSATKQSGRSIIPVVSGVLNFDEILPKSISYDLCLICGFSADTQPIKEIISSRSSAVTKVLLLVGGASGFSETEFNRALEYGFKPFSLGPRRLRAELAGTIAASILFYLSGDLGPIIL